MQEDEKRQYVRLSEAGWAQLEAEYSIGDCTIEELSNRHGPSVRSIHMRFRDRGIEKGSATMTLASAVAERVHARALSDVDTLADRARQAREDSYQAADLIERLTVAQLQAAQADPSAAVKMSGVFRALGLAAATIERTGQIKRTALGLKDDDLLGRELPVLTIADISDAEITRIQTGSDDSDDELFDPVELELPTDCA